MTGISTTGLGLPSAQSLFTGNATTTVPDPASTIPVNGPTVSGPGGTTVLPDAAPAEFQGPNPTSLDQPHPQYPALIQSHVAVLQAIGTPESVIAQLAATQPAADFLDRYIQGEIAQNPEGWDQFVGNPAGTARAGLQQLGFPLAPAGQGTPGVTLDGGRVDGINVPGVTAPLVGPEQSSGEGLVKGIVIAAAAIGVGLLAWKFIKNRNPANDAAKLLGSADEAKGLIAGVAAGEGNAGTQGLRNLVDAIGGGGGAGRWLGKTDDAGAAAQKLLGYQAVVGGGANTAGTSTAATLDAISRGFGPANGWAHSIGITSAMHNQPFQQVAAVAERGEMLSIFKEAVRTNQLGEFVAGLGLLSQQSQQAAAAAGGVAKNAGIQQMFAGAANLLG